MGHKLKIKCVDSRVNVHNLASTGVLNLALTLKKRITVLFFGLSSMPMAERHARVGGDSIISCPGGATCPGGVAASKPGGAACPGEEHAEGGSMPRENSILREPIC